MCDAAEIMRTMEQVWSAGDEVRRHLYEGR